MRAPFVLLRVDLSVARPHRTRPLSVPYNYGSVPNAIALRNGINALFKER
jgi:hypothetical protein